MSDGRLSVPYVLIAYMPRTCNNQLRMLYAGAKELLRREAETGRVVECADQEDVEGVEDVLKGGGLRYGFCVFGVLGGDIRLVTILGTGRFYGICGSVEAF